MKLTNEIIEQVRKIVEDNDTGYECIAVRVQEVPFELGEMSHVSHRWDDGDDTGEELDGVCGTAVNAIKANARTTYYGEHLAVIAGNHYTYGEDAGEVVISDPQVIAIIK
jgi:hypothetical protein